RLRTIGCVSVLPSTVSRTWYRPGAASGPLVAPPHRIMFGNVTAGENAPSHGNEFRPAERGGFTGPALPRPRPPPPPPPRPAFESAGAPPRPPRPPAAFVVSG